MNSMKTNSDRVYYERSPGVWTTDRLSIRREEARASSEGIFTFIANEAEAYWDQYTVAEVLQIRLKPKKDGDTFVLGGPRLAEFRAWLNAGRTANGD